MQYSINYREKDGGIQVIVQYKDKNGKWRQKSKQGIKKKSLAKIEADKILDQIKDTYDYFDNNSTINDFKNIYLDFIKLNRAYNTYVSKVNALSHFEGLLKIKFDDLKVCNIQSCINTMISDGLNTSTVKVYINAFFIFLKWTCSQYHLKIFDTSSISLSKFKSHSSKIALEDSELQEVLNYFSTYPDRDFYIAVLFGSKAGLRVGESMGLIESDLDFENEYIYINRQWKFLDSGLYGFGEPKSCNSYRKIPMSNLIKTEMLKLKENGYIRPGERIIKNVNTANFATALNYHLKKNFGITTHELRHTFATNLLKKKLDPKTTAQILGHTVNELLNTYSHVTDEMLNNAKNIINKM